MGPPSLHVHCYLDGPNNDYFHPDYCFSLLIGLVVSIFALPQMVRG